MDNWIQVYMLNIGACYSCLGFADYYHAISTKEHRLEILGLSIAIVMIPLLLIYLLRFIMIRSFLIQVAAES